MPAAMFDDLVRPFSFNLRYSDTGRPMPLSPSALALRFRLGKSET